MTEARQMTQKEVQERFMRHVAALVRYWAEEKRGYYAKPEHRLSGLAFSILTLMDGGSGDMPAFEMVPSPHEDDKDYHQDKGENWWPEKPLPLDAITVHGGDSLHEMWHKYDPHHSGK